MSKKFLLILLSGFFLATPKLISANEVEEKPSLTLFSQMKLLRSHFPDKSTFETDEEYQEKIDSINFSPPPINLEITPTSYPEGKYDPQKQQLEISLPTDDINLRYELPASEQKFAKEALYDDSYEDQHLIRYRSDLISSNKEIITCVNGLGAKSQYTHQTSHYAVYLINVIEKIDKIAIKMPPHQAKSYFNNEEKFLPNRFKVKLSLRPIAPFYSYLTSYESDECDNNKSFLTEKLGMTFTTLDNNHLIHAHLENLGVVDRITGQTIFETSSTDK
ncbi:MAG: hypothetical protein RLZZ04_3229 [Cyanobacteriota bacterium]|jgi:hypothetical protein